MEDDLEVDLWAVIHTDACGVTREMFSSSRFDACDMKADEILTEAKEGEECCILPKRFKDGTLGFLPGDPPN